MSLRRRPGSVTPGRGDPLQSMSTTDSLHRHRRPDRPGPVGRSRAIGPHRLRPSRRAALRAAAVAAAAAVAVTAAACGGPTSATGSGGTTGAGRDRATTTPADHPVQAAGSTTVPSSQGSGSGTTTTTQPAGATTTTTAPTHGPVTSPPLPAPGPGFVAGHVTAVGDSVMLDYQTALQQDVPGIDVQAAVSRQWTTGQALLQQLQAAGQLGAVVVVGLGTNGPITATDFDSMMSVLSGASRVVFVNVYVDRTWQDPNNAVLAAGVARYHNAVLADWYSLASQHTTWLYSTQTHLPINGPGAQALAALVAGKV